MTEERVQFIDIAKGIGILAIIVSHFSIPSCHILQTDKLYFLVHTFHVPIFFLIAGMLFGPGKGNFWDFACRKGSRLLLPYLFTCSFIFLIRSALSALNGDFNSFGHHAISMLYGSGWWRSKTLVGPIDPVGPIWFLWALFWALLIRRMVKSLTLGMFLAVTLVFGCFIWKRADLPWLPCEVQHASLAYFYVVAGGLLAAHTTILQRPMWWCPFLALGAFIIDLILKNVVNLEELTGHWIAYLMAIPISMGVLWFCLSCTRSGCGQFFSSLERILLKSYVCIQWLCLIFTGIGYGNFLEDLMGCCCHLRLPWCN